MQLLGTITDEKALIFCSTNGDTATGLASPSPDNTVWLKERQTTVERPYIQVREAALAKREQAVKGETPEEMRHLYEFWSQMLLSDFNDKVYDEFRNLSLDDVSRDARSGLRYLLDFYKNLFDSSKNKPWLTTTSIPEIFLVHHRQASDLDQQHGSASA